MVFIMGVIFIVFGVKVLLDTFDPITVFAMFIVAFGIVCVTTHDHPKR